VTDKTTITERGQTAVPARVRRESDAGPGTELVWEVIGPDEWKVTVVRRSPARPDPHAMRGFTRRFRATRRTADWMRELRAGDD
jgi:bifunctional DNA-binding transcriptional regulator/antitoxin component of YhaV-PrlF toxin-antitoxin module